MGCLAPLLCSSGWSRPGSWVPTLYLRHSPMTALMGHLFIYTALSPPTCGRSCFRWSSYPWHLAHKMGSINAYWKKKYLWPTSQCHLGHALPTSQCHPRHSFAYFTMSTYPAQKWGLPRGSEIDLVSAPSESVSWWLRPMKRKAKAGKSWATANGFRLHSLRWRSSNH